MADFSTGPYLGKFPAFVRDTNDPEKRGRIRCYCPDVMGLDDVPTKWLGWAEACLPSYGGANGVDFQVPLSAADAGHEQPVWVEFKYGHHDYPIWVGMGVYAPSLARTDLTKASVANQKGQGDVGLLGAVAEAGAGSSAGSLSPPQASPDQGDIVFMAKPDKRIVIGIEGGAFIILDGATVDIVGALPRINGKAILSSLDTIVGD